MATIFGGIDRRKMSAASHVILAFIALILPEFSTALRDVTINVPRAVKRGGNATLSCTYDLEFDNLYSVKWYKGKYEFYRYMPSGSPNIKVFILGNLRVDTSASNQTHLLLLDMQPEMSGKYTCEISMDAPDFTTAMISGELGVVELPKETAVVTGIQPRYRIGDLVDGNCSIKFSKPAANLTWTINGAVVPPHHIKTYQIEKHENGSLESVMSVLNFMVTTQHFIKGQMRLKCSANIYNIFKEEIENIIEEDRPRIMASGQSYDINNYPYEQHHRNGDGFEDQNESYLLTYYSAADTTSGAAGQCSSDVLFGMIKYLKNIWSTLKIFAKEAHDLTVGLIPLTPPSPSASLSTSLPERKNSHLSTRSRASLLSALREILQQSDKNNNNKKNSNNDNMENRKENAFGNREKFASKETFVILPIASCYVTLTIILTYHFMSCQNTKTTKATSAAAVKAVTAAPEATTKTAANVAVKSTDIVSCDISTNSSKRISREATPSPSPSTACSNKSFYNCPESIKANENKTRKLSLLKWQTSMKERKRQRQWQWQWQWQWEWQRQHTDSQFDDNIYDDCQQEEQQQQQKHKHKYECQYEDGKEHSQASNRILWTCSAILDTLTKSIEKYSRINNQLTAATSPDALLSLSKDQTLLMTFANRVRIPIYLSPTSLIMPIIESATSSASAFEISERTLPRISQKTFLLHLNRIECLHDKC